MGTRKQREKQEDIWIAHTELRLGSGASVLSAAERVAGGGALRRVCRGAVCEVLCGQVRTALTDAGDLLSFAADRIFRRHRGGARHCLATGRLTGAAAFWGIGLDDNAGPLHNIAHPAVDRCGHASRSVAWVLEVLADRGLLKGQRIAIDATTLEANAAMRWIVRRDTGESYEEFLRGLAKASGIETPTREDLVDSIASARSARPTNTGRVQRTRMRGSRR